MSAATPGENSLVLYKRRPARVLSVADKLEIELVDGKTQRVRPKDVMLLHPGPLHSLGELSSLAGEVEDAWELLAGDTTHVSELAELVFGQHTPSTSWATWQLVDEALYFYGTTPEEVRVRSVEDLQRERAAREAKAAEAQARSELLDRLRKGEIAAQDAVQLREVEGVCLGGIARSRILRELDLPETPESAHSLLLKLGLWDHRVNPHPRRLKLPDQAVDVEVPALTDEPRRDFTQLPAFAVDDDGNQDPDDAISLDNDRLWIHVADVAAIAHPGSLLDQEARGRGASLYLPEGVVPMLPFALTEQLGLGLNITSPALSFGVKLDESGNILDTEFVPSRVRVTRLTYRETEERLREEPFTTIVDMTKRYRQRRKERGAAFLALPEVKLRVEQGEVHIYPLPRLESREMVTDAMLMAGEAAARVAVEHGIPFPFATQPPPEARAEPKGMAAMFAYRKQLKRSQIKGTPEPHAGLGLQLYSQATSPLRRYPDLVAHQQLRAFLRDEPVLSADDILTRVGSADVLMANVRQGERLSNRHWTLAYLQQNSDWRGDGIIVEKRGRRGTILVPELGLDAQLQLSGDPPLDTVVRLRCTRVRLPELTANFRVID